MESATPNVVGALLARVRLDAAEIKRLKAERNTLAATAAPDAPAAEQSISQLMADEDDCMAREQAALRVGAEHERERVRHSIVKRVRGRAILWDERAIASGRAFSDKARVANRLAAEIQTMSLTEEAADG